MEVRKLEAGSRAWQARPGEHYLASTGERSGLWRHRGRPPQKLVGVGFTSEGMDMSVPYRRMPDSYHRAVSLDFRGRRGRGLRRFRPRPAAARRACEIDRYDLALGTPPHARILASSEPLTDNYPLVQEEIYFMTPGLGGTQHPWVRADIVYFTTPNQRRRLLDRLDRLGQRAALRQFPEPGLAADQEHRRRVPDARPAARQPLQREREALIPRQPRRAESAWAMVTLAQTTAVSSSSR